MSSVNRAVLVLSDSQQRAQLSDTQASKKVDVCCNRRMNKQMEGNKILKVCQMVGTKREGKNYALFFLDLIKLFQEEKSTWEKCDMCCTDGNMGGVFSENIASLFPFKIKTH